MSVPSNTKELADDLTQLIYNTLEMDQVYDFVLSYIEQKYSTELEDVTDANLKQHIVEQRLLSSFDECGIMDTVISAFEDLGITRRLKALENEKSSLQQKVKVLQRHIDSLVSDMTTLQINSFGRVVRLFDDRIIDLAKEDEDVEVIEKPDGRNIEGSTTQAAKGAWRTLQPSELLIGLLLTVSQPVLCRKGRDTWFPGRVSSCHFPSIVNKSPDSALYRITLDAAPGTKPEVCQTTPASLALAVSALELKQKYPVGARVVSIYRDDNGGIGYYSGLIAEPPSERNNHRYLLFFDDGYTQYSPPSEIYRICHQSKENWKEATEGSQGFIKRYLAQYPQRPMVRLKPGQSIETELDGEWIPTIVEKVDASLVLIRFSATHSEWIYRGSTRLEPLFNDMNSTPSLVPTHRNQGVEVEYGNIEGSLTDKSSIADLRNARKSATGNRDPQTICRGVETPRPTMDTRSSLRRSVSSVNMAELEAAGQVVPYLDHLFENLELKPFVSHKCNPSCLVYCKPPSTTPVSEDPFDYKGLNPLEIPFHAGWLRYLLVGHPRESERQMIVYRAPCGRQLRSMHEVQRFLDRTDSKLTTDLFCFDATVVINSEFRAKKTLTNIADISYGKENVPVPCVNSVDNEVPGYIDYIASRQPIDKVPLLKDDNFVVCCDCTDNCRDRHRCACQQLTAEASSLTNANGMVDPQAGYRYRRLSQFTVGGIYECNAKCPCDRRCSNRVVQHGLWACLQLFKTSRKGWGIRALHAIPKGAFLCTYAGAIYDENTAVQQGFDYGDEYQAELDYIETVEKPKDGYESMPEDPEEGRETDKEEKAVEVAMEHEDKQPHEATKQQSVRNLPKSQSTSALTKMREKVQRADKPEESNAPPINRPASALTLEEVESIESRTDMGSGSSSLSELTATELDDDRMSHCSDLSSSSSLSRNAIKRAGNEGVNGSIKTPANVRSQSEPVVQRSCARRTTSERSIGKAGEKTNVSVSQSATPHLSESNQSDMEVITTPSMGLETDSSEVHPDLGSPEIRRAGDQTTDTSMNMVDQIQSPTELVIIESQSGPTDSQLSLSPVSSVSVVLHDVVNSELQSALAHPGNSSPDQEITTKSNEFSPPSACNDSQPSDDFPKQTSLETDKCATAAQYDHMVISLSPLPQEFEQQQQRSDSTAEPGPSVSAPSVTQPSQRLEQMDNQLHSSVMLEPISAISQSKFNLADADKSRQAMSRKDSGERHRIRANGTDSNENDKTEAPKSRLKRSCVKARSSSLPKEFWSLHNARDILQTADFNRIPIVRITPVNLSTYGPGENESEEKSTERSDSFKLRRSARSAPAEKQSKEVEIKYISQVPESEPILSVRENRSKLSSVAHSKHRRHTVCPNTATKIDSVSKLDERSLRGKEKSSDRLRKRDAKKSETQEREASEPGSGKTEKDGGSQTSELRRSLRHRQRLEGTTKPREQQTHNHRHGYYSYQQARRCFPVGQPDWLHARAYFNDENPYIMDAKRMGNLGRYFNHSCNPNVFVQNVFIDSHDPRFPEVAFFTKRNIAVGEEMTWDYGYTVDAVPFKVLYCYCGEPNCRIRLL